MDFTSFAMSVLYDPCFVRRHSFVRRNWHTDSVFFFKFSQLARFGKLLGSQLAIWQATTVNWASYSAHNLPTRQVTRLTTCQRVSQLAYGKLQLVKKNTGVRSKMKSQWYILTLLLCFSYQVSKTLYDSRYHLKPSLGCVSIQQKISWKKNACSKS